MHQLRPKRLRELGARFQDVGVYELVGPRKPAADHVAVQGERFRRVVRASGVRGDHGGPEVDVRGAEVVEDAASVAEVGEVEGAEADELEDQELGAGMAEGDEEGLELLEVVDVGGSTEGGQDVLV